MTNSTNNISARISMSGKKAEEVASFKYLAATMCKDGTCSAEVRIRIASATAAMARLNRIWRFKTISFASKFKLCNSLVTSILLYGCESCTCMLILKKDPGFQNQVSEETSLHLLLRAKDQRLGAEQDQLPCGSTGTSSSTDGNFHGLCMSHATTSSPKPSFRTPWRVGDTVDGRGNPGWTTSKTGHPYPCQT